MRPTHKLRLITIVVAVALGAIGCDQQQPIAQQPAPDPGFKPGETPPVEPDKGTPSRRDDSAPLPPATAPTTPGEQNNPAAPVVPLPPAPAPTEDPATSRQVQP